MKRTYELNTEYYCKPMRVFIMPRKRIKSSDTVLVQCVVTDVSDDGIFHHIEHFYESELNTWLMRDEMFCIY